MEEAKECVKRARNCLATELTALVRFPDFFFNFNAQGHYLSENFLDTFTFFAACQETLIVLECCFRQYMTLLNILDSMNSEIGKEPRFLSGRAQS